MKVGSLVECLKHNSSCSDSLKGKGARFPHTETVYTVREIRDGSSTRILLEEIDNSHLAMFTPSKREPGFNILFFRELQPPIANIEEHINENTLELQPNN